MKTTTIKLRQGETITASKMVLDWDVSRVTTEEREELIDPADIVEIKEKE